MAENKRRTVNRVSSSRRGSRSLGETPRRDVGESSPEHARRGDRDESSRASIRGPQLVAALAFAAAVLIAVAVLAAFRPGATPDNRAFVDTEATDQVKAAAEHTMKTLYGYDVAHIDGYKAAAGAVLTDRMRTEFDKTVDATVSMVKQTQTSTEVTADPIGVTQLTDNRAELLVDLTVSATKNGVPQESAAGPIVLRMTKVGDRWLASDIVDRD